MGVYFNKGAVKSKKEVQEQIDKMNSLYNDIVRHIQNMENSNDYLVIRQLIREYEGLGGVSQMQVADLYNRLYEGLSILLEDSQDRQESLSAEVDKIQQRSFVEHASTLKELNVQSNEIMFQFQMKLNQNTTKESGGINRRLVGNWVKNADRVHAIALSKLSLMQNMPPSLRQSKEKFCQREPNQPNSVCMKRKNRLIWKQHNGIYLVNI